ncbi:NAD(P)-linked oxidoreductase [Glarea lozoyensis ATCC 20868]|uniref:NAD(P)-linked oxidoreductase n=1 Tax=Glarea lozoyensis (strain ATCC 20868 / MF5171) TaxID=1116229 RepID=S3D091_GLAL2|nr:NAD(P)-linked oxidoreductase [Glarea lozoyensis ATCC 20868]EPE30579.1 NAD(P)-linked oxidoreductase [Glarea lozoyensis ATCC 20868]
MTQNQKSAVNVIFGAMTFGREGTEQARVSNLDDCKAILDIFQAHGHNQIDTARFYGEGSSEQYLGDLDWQSRGIVMDTKYFPTAGKPLSSPDQPEGGWTHSPEHVKQNLMTSLKALKTDKVDMWYLHAPDRSTPYEVTLKAINELYKEGRFKRWAVSNYMAWEVAQMCEICKREGYPLPSVYQGVYNALHRAVEPELFPCLRKYGMAFYAFNPLAGGYLTARYKREEKSNKIEEGSRFDPNRMQGKMYRQRYWNEEYFDALDILREAAGKHGLSEAECALRWMTHHSLLKKEFGDGIIIGASSTKHMEENMKFLDDPNPLPEDILQALDAGWDRVKGISNKYFH